ncbi:MAG: 50S ribosomal protein L2 [Candidatus Aenigmarchaeota archaeon]|nr:50S ribosomal protein L2 [Candidatus Aenigmarchaeota archaeon]NIP41025.1 50S ribosomal protein L2 [Candidatus Aenigmarchaeota archaeon]NIQ17427.1 50S ribosomal protein L2 [Candidatus Aenigmarchaeota archaeon]NIS73621.1 50S ribosomal protein L2 [Candidatus Aenigmarchaeota archaeon]
MGKRIISQRRGRGSPTYRVPKRGKNFAIAYKNIDGVVREIMNDPGRNAPLAKVRYTDGTYDYLIAPKGLKVGDSTEFVSPLSKIPVGMQVFCIETSPNSGPKLCRTSGSFATVVSKTKKSCVVQLPSKKKMNLNPECRASIGVPAGEGFREKPWTKAGKKWIAMHRRGKLYPRTSGVAMNAVDHPFGGPTKPGKPMSVSRDAPPGRKVGSWGSRRTGRRRGKK